MRARVRLLLEVTYLSGALALRHWSPHRSSLRSRAASVREGPARRLSPSLLHLHLLLLRRKLTRRRSRRTYTTPGVFHFHSLSAGPRRRASHSPQQATHTDRESIAVSSSSLSLAPPRESCLRSRALSFIPSLYTSTKLYRARATGYVSPASSILRIIIPDFAPPLRVYTHTYTRVALKVSRESPRALVRLFSRGDRRRCFFARSALSFFCRCRALVKESAAALVVRLSTLVRRGSEQVGDDIDAYAIHILHTEVCESRMRKKCAHTTRRGADVGGADLS